MHHDMHPARLDAEDSRTVREAGARFAADLAGAAWARFMVALGERGDRLRRAVLDAGHTPEQARLAVAHFEAAARAEWMWIEAAINPPVSRVAEVGTPHAFERKGLGRAPFRFVKLVREPGDCAYCGRVLARCCHIADATGRRFVVGVDCVWRAHEDGRLSGAVQAELRHQNKTEAAAKIEARRLACLAALQADPGFLADRPHPDTWRPDETLRDEAWRLIRGTVAERTKAFRIIEAALAERGGVPPP